MPFLYLATSVFLLFDSVFVGSFRKALAPVNGRIVDVLVGVFLAITLGSSSNHENDFCSYPGYPDCTTECRQLSRDEMPDEHYAHRKW
jgi:hypothetical protein